MCGANQAWVSSAASAAALPLKLTMGGQTRFTQFIERKAQALQRCGRALLAHAGTRLDGWRIAPDDLPATGLGTLERAAKLLAIGADRRAFGSGTDGLLQRQVHHRAGEADEILLMAQWAVDTGRGHFEALVLHAIDFQRKLQLAGDFLAILHRDKLFWHAFRADVIRTPRQVDGDAQKAAGRAFDLHQVVAQAAHRL